MVTATSASIVWPRAQQNSASSMFSGLTGGWLRDSAASARFRVQPPERVTESPGDSFLVRVSHLTRGGAGGGVHLVISFVCITACHSGSCSCCKPGVQRALPAQPRAQLPHPIIAAAQVQRIARV